MVQSRSSSSRFWRRLCVVLASTAVLTAVTVQLPDAAGAAGSPPTHEAHNRVVKKKLRTLVRSLPVKRERPAGYDRDKFNHWTDANHDCEDARAEVLKQESKKRVKLNKYCTVKTGLWRSYYDGARFRKASKLDVDHTVPLADAWRSGARRWRAGTRERYANDLRDKRTLVAVSLSTNRSKGDRDPADWMPRRGKCRYVRSWAAVKTRWHLRVDRAEKKKLRRVASHCPNRRVRVKIAKVR